MNYVKFSAVVVTGLLSFAGMNAPAFAVSPASIATDAFLNNLVPNLDFLDRASRFALTNSKNARLRDFAHGEAREQTLAANAVDDWIEARKNPLVATTTNPDQVVTGRSVAVDPAPTTAVQAAPIVDNRLAMGQEDLDSLEGLEGKAFDDQYKQKELDALTQVQTDYETYLATGDDPVLLAISKTQLPNIKRRLTALGKL